MTINDPFLRAFLQQCSGHAEAMFEPDRPAGEFMLARIIAEAINGKITVFACPMGPNDELMFRVGVPRRLRAAGKHRHWCFFAEAWAAERTVGKPAPMPKDDPARMEVVSFAAENAAGEVLLAERQIYRAPGQPARLLPLVFTELRKKFVMEETGEHRTRRNR
jgi:hypothetical protein